MLIIRDTKACLPSSPRMVHLPSLRRKKIMLLDLLEKKIMPSHGSLTRETNGDLYGLKKKSQKYITSFE